jgi:glyoxylase-like metal-dependent hydrolase (beta-lactamase superfamily II)
MARVEPLQADVVLDDKADLLTYGVEAWVVHLPGHSPGSLSISLVGAIRTQT